MREKKSNAFTVRENIFGDLGTEIGLEVEFNAQVTKLRSYAVHDIHFIF